MSYIVIVDTKTTKFDSIKGAIIDINKKVTPKVHYLINTGGSYTILHDDLFNCLNAANLRVKP